MSPARVLVLLKRSVYQTRVLEQRDARFLKLLEERDASVARVRPGHEDHMETIEEVRRCLATLPVQARFDEHLRSEVDISDVDLVVTVGGDGTLLAASHRLSGAIPIVGINSSPDHSVGFFCAARKGAVADTLRDAVAGALPAVRLARMSVDVNGVRKCNRVLNEALFCHKSPAATSRYIIRVERTAAMGSGPVVESAREEEEQKSSGVWIGPAAGSTAAQKSAGGEVMPLESRDLQYVVREPYLPRSMPRSLLLGRVSEGASVHFCSKMSTACMYLDGELRVVPVGFGDTVSCTVSSQSLFVLGLSRPDPA